MDLDDWIKPMLGVPYVPTLGPTHPDAVTAELVAEVVAVAGTGRHLPHDKDRRWCEVKDEHVLADAVHHDDGLTLVPTLTRRGPGRVKVHVYGNDPEGRDSDSDRAHALAGTLRSRFGVASSTVVTYRPHGSVPAAGSTVRIQLASFDGGRAWPLPDDDIAPLDDRAAGVATTFAAFAAAANEGFPFLYERRREGRVGPVLTAVRGGRIVGAIGPMETLPDPLGRSRLLPQYFALLPPWRGQGLGRALWRAAMYWGQKHGAAYQLLQTVTGGPSDRLCQTEGLTDLGFLHTRPG